MQELYHRMNICIASFSPSGNLDLELFLLSRHGQLNKAWRRNEVSKENRASRFFLRLMSNTTGMYGWNWIQKLHQQDGHFLHLHCPFSVSKHKVDTHVLRMAHWRPLLWRHAKVDQSCRGVEGGFGKVWYLERCEVLLSQLSWYHHSDMHPDSRRGNRMKEDSRFLRHSTYGRCLHF